MNNKWLSLLVVFTPLLHAADRPNILFAFADDWGRYASIYAEANGARTPNDLIRTPHFVRVAREGVLFRNAYVTAPSCTPCRSSLLSGQYFFRTGRGAILQGAVWDSSIPSYPLLLEKHGYHIGFTYKVWSPGTPANAGYGGAANSYGKAGGSFNGFSQTATSMIAKGKSVDEAKAELFKQVTGNFDQFLAARKTDQPFCYWFGPTNVHRKWTAGSGKKLWGLDPEKLQGKLPPFLPDVPVVREDFADYLGEAMAFDSALGLLLAKLEEMGELENTLVVVSGDHGAPGFPRGKCNLYDFGTGVALAARWGKAEGGRVVDDFVNLMDLAPTFLDAGGVAIPDVMTGRSILPVLQSEKTGLVDPTRTWVITGRERHVAKARAGGLPYPQRALRTQDYLYIINFEPDRYPMGDRNGVLEGKVPSHNGLVNNTFDCYADLDASPTKAFMVEHRNDPKWKAMFELGFGKFPREELYVITDDPHQMNNVAKLEHYTTVRKQLEAQLLTELKRVADPRVSQDPVPFEYPPFVGEVAPKAQRKGKKKGRSPE